MAAAVEHLAGADAVVVARLRLAARIGALLVGVTAALVLLGWAADVQVLKRVASGFAPMKVDEALCYLLLAAAVLATLTGGSRGSPEILLAVTALIIGLALGEMSGLATTCLVVLVGAVLALRRGSHQLAQLLAGVAVLGSSVGLLGYLYGVHDLYRVGLFKGLALHAAGCLLALALCVLFVEPDRALMAWLTSDAPDGWSLRVLLPAVCLTPVTLAYLVVQGVSHHWVELPVGAAVVVPVMTVLSLLFIALIARRLHAVEQERRRVTASLAVAHAELSRRIEYAGIVAHDLRNPLSAILAYGQLLQQPQTLADTPRAQRHAATIVRMAESLNTIVEDILSVARLEAGTMALNRTRLELVDYLDELLRQAELAYPAAHLKAVVNLGEAYVDADTVQLSRVLFNLISNAVKFSPPEGTITLRLTREDDRAVICVEDHGPGVPPEDAPILFEKFSQLPSGAKVEGSGLGLFICRSIIEAHGGHLWVEPTPGGGATFGLSLEAVTRGAPRARPTSLSRAATGG
jgi:signal transduction histidine kinase